MSEALDPRINACRPDLADAALEGRVEAARFVEGTIRRVVMNSVPLRKEPDPDASFETEFLCGEAVRVFDETDAGWSWVQGVVDGYVGYLPSAALRDPDPPPTHAVTALRTFVYPGPDMKLPALTWLSFGSQLALTGDEMETRGTHFRVLADGAGAVVASHVVPVDAPPAPDFVAVAERFLETPYLWGGRTSLGLDCSALIQLALMAAGIPCPRDTDMQEAGIGTPVDGGVEASLLRGDLIFWKGHIGIMTGRTDMVHASGHHMTVVVEPLAGAVARIATSAGRPTVVKRL